MANTKLELRGLVLSASELRQLTDWPEALIEDYLNIFNNLILLSDEVDKVITPKLEEVETEFADKIIPFVNNNFLIEDSRLTWDFNTRTFTADGVHVSAGRRKGTTLVNASPYNVLLYDEELFIDTTSEPITINLLAGVSGATYRIHNIGEAGNAVTITPDGLDLLFGVNSSEVLYDTEVVIITFNDITGWD